MPVRISLLVGELDGEEECCDSSSANPMRAAGVAVLQAGGQPGSVSGQGQQATGSLFVSAPPPSPQTVVAVEGQPVRGGGQTLGVCARPTGLADAPSGSYLTRLPLVFPCFSHLCRLFSCTGFVPCWNFRHNSGYLYRGL